MTILQPSQSDAPAGSLIRSTGLFIADATLAADGILVGDEIRMSEGILVSGGILAADFKSNARFI